MIVSGISFIEKYTDSPYWKSIYSFLLPLVVLFFAFPSFSLITEHWDPILVQSKNPFEVHVYPPHSHASKLAFRFVPALIIGWLNLSVFGIIIWQYLNGIFLFYLVGLFVEKKTNNKVIAFLSMLILAFIFTGKVSFINFKDTFDSLILSLIIICFLVESKFLIFFLILIISFIDERGLICSGFIFLYYLLFNNNLKGNVNRLLFIVLSWFFYFVIRISLTKFIGLATSTGGFDLKTLALNLNFAPLSIWQIYEGGWFVVIYFMFYLFKSKSLTSLFFFFQFLIVLIVGFLVYDVTRSLVYEFPLFLISLQYLNPIFEKNRLNILVLLSAVVSFLYPAYCSGGQSNLWLTPLPIKLIFEYFTNN